MAWLDKLLGRTRRPSKEDLRVDDRSRDPAPFALALAADLARALPGSTIVDKTAQSSVEVRWKDAAIPMRISLDLAFGSLGSLDIEAIASGFQGEFNLHFEPDLTRLDDDESADAWEEEHRIFFAKSVFVTGSEAEARQAAAIVRSLGVDLVDELAREMEIAAAPRFWADEARVGTAIPLFTIEDRGAAALRLAAMVARVATALPRAVATTESAIRCSYCHGLWFPAPGREACCHCGARN